MRRMQQGDSLWQAVLGEIELSVSRASFMTWFKRTRLLSHNDNTLVIGVPNVFIKQQMEERFNELVVGTLKKNGVAPTTVTYKIYTIPTAKTDDDPVILRNSLRSATPAPASTSHTSAPTYRQGLNSDYTFENFIVGASNELAYAACQAVAANPGTKYNPLFLYGGVGIGKTHLIQAVGNAIVAAHPSARVVYVSTEQFVQEFVDALRFKRNMSDFVGYYRGADVLIVDDVQFLAGKEKIQEEFFHTFNSLHQAKKQMIISSDTQPKDIPTVEDRLRSRLLWGMSIDMQNPDFETRCAIVQTKAESHEVTLETDVAEYLAANIQTNIRELEGALNQLLAYCEMRGLEPNLELATGLLGSTKTRPRHVSARQIVERTARHFQITLEEIIGPKRDKDIVVPRQVAMYMLRSELHLSFPKIARELGRKDHTTAIHSVEKIEKESALDADIRLAITNIKERLYV